MSTNKRTERIIGGLFITGTAAGVLSAVLTGPALSDANLLTAIYENQTQMIIGVIAVLVMAAALATIPFILFPIFKKYNKTLAIGAVVFRGVLEAIAYIAIALSWIFLMILGHEYTKSGLPDPAALRDLGASTLTVGDWINQILAVVFSIGALMIYYLFYISKLIPRWLSIFGLVGAVLYLAAPLSTILGYKFDLLMAPLALQEMILAVWLIVKGFNPVIKNHR